MIRRRIGYAAVALLVAAPCALAVPGLAALAPADAAGGLLVAGRALGVAGLAAYLVAGVLSVRVPGLDQYFGGLTKLWRFHHYLGIFTFAAVMLHVLCLALGRAAAGTGAATAMLFPGGSPFGGGVWPVWAGWLAVVGMSLFLGVSFQFWGRPEYQRWKRLHRLAGPVALLGLAHGLALDRSLGPAAAWLVWGGLGALTVGAFAYRVGVSPRLARRARVAEATPLAPGVVELTIDGLDRPLDYRAGQFVYLTHLDRGRTGCGEEHPFTLASSPAEGNLRIGIKAAGDATRAMQTLPVDTPVRIDGPYGDFFQLPPSAPQLWIAGGIGIAPFIAGARDLAAGDPGECDVHLIYCVQDPGRAYYHDELAAIGNRVAGFTVTLHREDREGFLTRDFLLAHCPDAAGRAAFVCGPPGLSSHTRRLLPTVGIPSAKIHTEEFDLL